MTANSMKYQDPIDVRSLLNCLKTLLFQGEVGLFSSCRNLFATRQMDQQRKDETGLT